MAGGRQDREAPRKAWRTNRRIVVPIVRSGLALVMGATMLSVVSAATVVGVGLLTASPAGAYLGCPLGAGAVKGKVAVAHDAPAATRLNNTTYNGSDMTQETAFPQNVNPGGEGAFHYCGKSVFTWPVETRTEYRINGPKVGNSLTGYIVDIHTKIPFKGDNVYGCSVRQEYGPEIVDPFYCRAQGTDSGSRYATIANFTIERKKLTTVTDPHQQARLLADHCVRGETRQCVFDSKNLNTNLTGPKTNVGPTIDGQCHADTPYTYTWSQTISTTESIGSSASVTVAIGKLLPIVQASVSATYGFSWTASITSSGSIPYTIPKGQRLHLVRSAKLNEVTGGFVLAGNGDTNYLIPHASFTWADKSEAGTLTPVFERRADC